jgi:TetR/AcrR family transcriptional regulator
VWREIFMNSNSLHRRQRERLRHRDEILQVALELFSEKGYHNVSMEEIARKSEFGTGTLYTFFSNKEELYKTMALEKGEQFHSSLISAMNIEGDEYKKIRSFVDTYVKLFAENVSLARIYLAERRGWTFNIKAGLDDSIRVLYEDLLERMSEIFASGIEKKIFKKHDPYMLAVAIDGITSSFLLHSVHGTMDKHTFDADMILDIFFAKIHQSESAGE